MQETTAVHAVTAERSEHALDLATEEITLLPVREFPDRGTKWLLETPENTNCLLRIIAADLADCIDFSRLQP